LFTNDFARFRTVTATFRVKGRSDLDQFVKKLPTCSRSGRTKGAIQAS
jgi:hypothetical protein